MQPSTFAPAPLTAAIALSLTTPAMAALTYEGENGSLSFGGDVELDINAYNSQRGEQGSIFFAEGIDSRDEFDQTGRILLEVAGERRAPTNHRVSFKAQPLVGTDGGIGVDDAWLAIGNDREGEIRVGRFEAFDLFPLGQDVFVEHNGDTANDLYRDGSGYVYQAKEGRGRGGSAGQVMLSQHFGDLYVELGTLFGDRRDLFDTDTYHGFAIDDDTKNAAILRPVVAWTPGPWTLAAGMETNVVGDAVVDERGRDISDRTGYAARLSYAAGDLSANLNLAYLDAFEERDATLGLNVLWRGFGVGYIHADNEVDEVNPAADPETVTPPGDYTVDSLYTSYQFDDVLGIEDFQTYLGVFYSVIDHEASDDLSAADRYGARLRLKYYF